MGEYRLVVQNRGPNSRSDCRLFDLKGSTAAEAAADAERLLVGDRSQWKMEWIKTHLRDEKVPYVHLDPEGHLDHGALLSPGANEPIEGAWIVEVVGPVDVAALQTEIEGWSERQKASLKQDPEYVEYLRLKKKFG